MLYVQYNEKKFMMKAVENKQYMKTLQGRGDT